MELVNTNKGPRSYCCQILIKFPFEWFLPVGIKAIVVACLFWLLESFILLLSLDGKAHQFSSIFLLSF